MNLPRSLWLDHGTLRIILLQSHALGSKQARMPNGYQPPKFLQFDGKGNPKQHIAHFVETYENARTQGGLLVK